VQPLVPGFITGDLRTQASGSEWSAVRSLDGHPFALKIIPVADLTQSLALAREQMAEYDRIGSEHLVRRHSAVATADGRLALVLDDLNGGSLAQLLAARGQLTPGETVTTVAPLFRTLADLHMAGVVHGDLAPGNVLFSSDGRPLIGDLGVARLMVGDAGPSAGTGLGTGASAGAGSPAGTGASARAGSPAGTGAPAGAGCPAGTGGFSAPEVVDGAGPSSASDVYAMAALGWFCLTGAAPVPAAIRRSLTSLRPETPDRLVKVLTACLATNPAARPSAAVAAVEVFEAAPAESVALASVSDPGAEITRRIRAAAASDSGQAPSGTGKRRGPGLVPGAVGVLALLLVALGAGMAWFPGRPPVKDGPVAARPAARPPVQPAMLPSATPAGLPSTAGAGQTPTVLATLPATLRRAAPTTAVPGKPPASTPDVLTAASSPRVAAAALLQGLVDARALAYVARSPALLDLVYAPGAPKAYVDRGNIATALKNGGTYLGLSFGVRDVAFLDGTSHTARIRATILTPAYKTGQPDGRTIPHAQEILGPCTFSLSLTPDGWRILALTTP
jgi:hypothetical protein